MLELAPNLSDAHVNTDYALLGMQRHLDAHDYFLSAIELKSNQVNTYYGLALALGHLGINTVQSAPCAVLSISLCLLRPSYTERGDHSATPTALLCSSHPTAGLRLKFASVTSSGSVSSRIAATISGASVVRLRNRAT